MTTAASDLQIVPRQPASAPALLAVVRRKPDSHRFEVLPRWRVVERTLAWLSRCRRLSKDYEERTETSEAWVHVAMVNLMLKRLPPAWTHLSHTL